MNTFISIKDQISKYINHIDLPILEPDTPKFILPTEHELNITTIKLWILKARKKYFLSKTQLLMPILSYNLSGNTMGLATTEFPSRSNNHTWKQTITLNPMYAQHNAYQTRVEIIPHEVCHLVVHILNPWKTIKPHGQEWQNVCDDLGFFNKSAKVIAPNFKDVERMIITDMLKSVSEEDF